MGSEPVDLTDPAQAEDYLRAQGWLASDERVEALAPAGVGNMNLVLRVRTGSRSLVVKQGRPWVERYPHIPAPARRTGVEHEWYAMVADRPRLAARVPAVIGYDSAAQVLALTDLGERGDLSRVYAGAALGKDQLRSLTTWLGELHATFAGDDRAARLLNREMRALNHEHIFAVPLTGRGAPDPDEVAPGLGGVADRLRADRRFTDAVSDLGQVYLGPGSTLLHGDFFPGSWLAAGDEPPWVIDPEFGFYGPPEWDVGVLLAHLLLAGQPPALAGSVRQDYGDDGLDWSLAAGFAGAEVTRRLLGVARLPLSLDLPAATALLGQARGLVVDGFPSDGLPVDDMAGDRAGVAGGGRRR